MKWWGDIQTLKFVVLSIFKVLVHEQNFVVSLRQFHDLGAWYSTSSKLSGTKRNPAIKNNDFLCTRII